LKGFVKIHRIIHPAHAFATAASDSLDKHRIANLNCLLGQERWILIFR